METRIRLGDLLIQTGQITDEQLGDALRLQADTRNSKKSLQLGDCLIQLGFITAIDIALTLAKQLSLDYISMEDLDIDDEMLYLVNAMYLRRYNVLPLRYTNATKKFLEVAMVDPLNYKTLDDLVNITGCMILPKVTTLAELNTILDKHLGNVETTTAADEYRKDRFQDVETEDGTLDLSQNSPIVKLVQSIIEQAARQRASDIHFEILEKTIRVRYRIDGVLVLKNTFDISLLTAVIIRIKILAQLDIAEKRKPQDGRMTLLIDKQEFDIRVSILPTQHGEKVVMRLASKQGFNKTKEQLGLAPQDLSRFEKILQNPNGIVLVTGPTGSGKSTTLYTALSSINTEDKNIVTVEEPIEADIDGINQVNVNVKAGLTFAGALRSILRQDPDIIMVGEIRDEETANIAVQASITGHLVVSTLHTNSSASAITRLGDMGIEPYLLADSIVGVIAQRLIRVLCPQCKTEREVTAEEERILGVNTKVYDPVGCPACEGLGFRGRIGVYEIMLVTQELRQLIAKNVTADEIKDLAVLQGMQTLRENARQKVLDGTTTVGELLKVSMEY